MVQALYAPDGDASIDMDSLVRFKFLLLVPIDMSAGFSCSLSFNDITRRLLLISVERC